MHLQTGDRYPNWEWIQQDVDGILFIHNDTTELASKSLSRDLRSSHGGRPQNAEESQELLEVLEIHELLKHANL